MELGGVVSLLLLTLHCSSAMSNQGHLCAGFPKEFQFLCWGDVGNLAKVLNPNELSNNAIESLDFQNERNSGHTVFGNAIETKPKLTAKGCDVTNCKRCSGSHSCEKCNEGYYMQFHSETENFVCVKKCFAKYLPTINANGVRSCAEIFFPKCHIRRCLVCLDPNICTTCNPGYHLQFHSDWEKTICVKNCFAGYALSLDLKRNKVCKKVPALEGCQDIACTLCKQGYFMFQNRTNKSPCGRSCPRGYLKDRIRRLCVWWAK